MSKLNDFQWRAEELDKLKVSEYKYVNIQIDNDYQWGSGWTSEQERRFTNEVYPKLREAGYSINAPTMSGACSTLSVRGDRHTDIYMHPMNFTGYAKVEDIEKLEALLSGCECIDNVNIIRKDDCYDLSDHNYRKLIAAHAKEIMACLDEKTSKYDVGLDFAEKHRIPRVGDKMGLSSFDVDVSAVEMVFETAKNLGYFEERSRQATQNTSQINNVDASVAVPLYKEDITTAKNNGEVELYKQSLNYNKACAKDIDKAIHSYYADNNFDARAAFKESDEQQEQPRETPHNKNDEFTLYEHEDTLALFKNRILISDADKHTNSADELYVMIPNNATVWTVHDDGSGSLKMDNQTVARYDLATREINMGDGWEVANCSRFEDVREYVYTKLNLSEYGEPRLANEATREKQEADSTKHEQWENYGDENFIENGGLLLRHTYSEAERAADPSLENKLEVVKLTVKESEAVYRNNVVDFQFDLNDYMKDKSTAQIEAKYGADFKNLSAMENAAVIIAQDESIPTKYGVPPLELSLLNTDKELARYLDDIGYKDNSIEKERAAKKAKNSIERD